MTTETSSRWKPLLDGDLAARAERVLLQIAGELRRSPVNAPFPDGPAARALFFGYLAEAWPDGAWVDLAGAQLEAALQQLAEQPLEAYLFHGFVGTAWVYEHLSPAPDDDELDGNAPIDAALAQRLASTPGRGSYEMMHGLTGIGLYAVERLHRPSARALLARVVEQLDQTAIVDDAGVRWQTPVEDIAEELRPLHPAGLVSLGAAHGLPATIALLALADRHRIEAVRARRLLDGAMRWLLAQRLDGASSRLPRVVDVGSGLGEPSRLAWCYGDAGAGVSLLWAARLTDDAGWRAAALELLHHRPLRAPSEVGVVDASFCHGSAGLGHLYNRAQQATGDATLRQAARLWLERTLDGQRPDPRCAGYLAAGDDRFVADESLLTGIAGIGLTLLAAITPVEPRWDRLFACAVPPR